MPGPPAPPPQFYGTPPPVDFTSGSLPSAQFPVHEQKHEYKFGIAHKPKETFQHAFGGSFGAMFGSTLGQALGCFVVCLFLLGGCVALAVVGQLAAPREGQPQRSNSNR